MGYVSNSNTCTLEETKREKEREKGKQRERKREGKTKERQTDRERKDFINPMQSTNKEIRKYVHATYVSKLHL